MNTIYLKDDISIWKKGTILYYKDNPVDLSYTFFQMDEDEKPYNIKNFTYRELYCEEELQHLIPNFI